MKAILSLLLLLSPAFVAPRAMAGPNAGGTILLHYRVDLACSVDGLAGQGNLPSCEEAVVQAPVSPGIMVLYAYAAFPEGSSPRLSVITYGLDYSATSIVITGFGNSGDFDLGTTDPPWPQPGSGDAVAWNTAQTGTLTEFYWFCVYAVRSDVLSLGPHPTQGGGFTDDAIPAHTDDIADYGSMGFGYDGHHACPTTDGQGACCRTDGTCLVSTIAECRSPNHWMGSGTTCDPDPCTTIGACCTVDGSCFVTIQGECREPNQWMGEGSDCAPNPCPPALTGACCLEDGECVIRTLETCRFPDQWMGYGTNCIVGRCPPARGACCYEDGLCVITIRYSCDGTWLGPATLCVPDPCDLPLGACCIPGSDCMVTIEDGCRGTWFLGQDCDPTPCHPVPTVPSTWGRIKNRYR